MKDKCVKDFRSLVPTIDFLHDYMQFCGGLV